MGEAGKWGGVAGRGQQSPGVPSGPWWLWCPHNPAEREELGPFLPQLSDPKPSGARVPVCPPLAPGACRVCAVPTYR